MAELKIYNLEAKEVGTIKLADEVFAIEPNKQVLFDALIMQQASRRQGTHSTKTRSEVRGGGRKPYRQKGTGRARQGSIRSVQFRGGGIAFGPKPRSYSYKLNRKVRRLALRSALSIKVANKKMLVLDSLLINEIKTQSFIKVMNSLELNKKTLFVFESSEDVMNAYLSMRNLQNVMLLSVEELNVYDIVNAENLVMTKQAATVAGEVLA